MAKSTKSSKINNLVAKHMKAVCRAVTMKPKKGKGSYTRNKSPVWGFIFV